MIPDPTVWFQVSSRHRTVARLPDGKSGIEALLEVAPHLENIAALGEVHAGDQYLRVYAPQKQALSPQEWQAFRVASGGTYARKR